MLRRIVAAAALATCITVVPLVPPHSALASHALPCDLKGIKEYPGDAAPKAAIAQWMGYHAAKAGVPAELPVMAALVESELANLPGGDTDTAGYFQMRLAIWNSGPYLGYATNPDLQLHWFIDQALIVREQWLAAGLELTESGWGEWIADVERPAEQYRGRYQLRLDGARELLCTSADG